MLTLIRFGRVSPEAIEKAITNETILISIMHSNNETGTLQPIKEIGEIAKRYGIAFHTDASQSVGKVPVNVDELKVDMLRLPAISFMHRKELAHCLFAMEWNLNHLFMVQGMKMDFGQVLKIRYWQLG